MVTESVDSKLESTIEKQMQVVKQAYSNMKNQLHKYRLTMMPTKTDPDARAQAFLQDPEAIEARLAYRRECAKLERMKHPEYYQESRKRDYYKHKEARLATNRKWYQNNPGRAVTWVRDWQRRHPEKDAEIRHRRRARLAEVESTYTNDDYELLRIIQEDKCAYCSQLAGWGNTDAKLVPEHMTPIVKGGDNTIHNIVLACHGKGSCNSIKHDKTVDEYLTYLELTKGVEASELVSLRLSEVIGRLEALLAPDDSNTLQEPKLSA